MDWCPIQGESMTLIRLAPWIPWINTGHIRLHGTDLTTCNSCLLLTLYGNISSYRTNYNNLLHCRLFTHCLWKYIHHIVLKTYLHVSLLVWTLYSVSDSYIIYYYLQKY